MHRPEVRGFLTPNIRVSKLKLPTYLYQPKSIAIKGFTHYAYPSRSLTC